MRAVLAKSNIVYLKSYYWKGLSKVAVELDEVDPEVDIIYKLHLGEYARWKDEYSWLKGFEGRRL